jgi:uncharacterized protein (DUF427 family)
MSLTISQGPLAGHPPETVNYTIDGPAHRLYMHAFPRRIRAGFGGETVLDSTRAMLLHETGLGPQLYIPNDDIRQELLTATTHHTHCPFKGDASYWSVTAGGRTAENAMWAYPEPTPESDWLRGYAAFYWDRLDEWYDEDERVEGHIRDPFHRVDARQSSRHVRVVAEDGEVLAETARPYLVSETGLPNRFYFPPEDVRGELLTATDTHTVCPYKGTASYWSVKDMKDAVWSYPDAHGDAQKISGYLSFLHEGLTTEDLTTEDLTTAEA